MAGSLKPAQPRRGSRRQPQASRNAILRAALAEFAQEGLAGARVDAIAEAAGVNKALLYYYFQDKETLYGATLENFFAPLHQRVMEVCDRPGPAGERFLSYAREHFDSIAASPHHGRIFMGELMSVSRGGKTYMDRILSKYMLPIGMRFLKLMPMPEPSIEERRAAVLDFIAAALFTDRQTGIKLAARISAAAPSNQPHKPALSRTKGKRK
jgi:TetR/AcrR family transcriptional regulator